MSFGSKLELQPGSWLELIYDVIIGVVTGAYHSLYLSSRVLYTHFIKPIVSIFIDLDKYSKTPGADTDNNKEREGLKVVAVGYGRTGTVSSTTSNKTMRAPKRALSPLLFLLLSSFFFVILLFAGEGVRDSY